VRLLSWGNEPHVAAACTSVTRHTIRIGAIVAIVAIGILLFLAQRHGTVVERPPIVASPIASSTPVLPLATARPQSAQATHFLPQLPPPQLVPRKPSIFVAPPKAKTGNPP
jgi:hypothetical protein